MHEFKHVFFKVFCIINTHTHKKKKNTKEICSFWFDYFKNSSETATFCLFDIFDGQNNCLTKYFLLPQKIIWNNDLFIILVRSIVIKNNLGSKDTINWIENTSKFMKLNDRNVLSVIVIRTKESIDGHAYKKKHPYFQEN